MISRRIAQESDIRPRLAQAKSEGDLPKDANPEDLSRYIATVIQGMAVQAAGGATRDELQRAIDVTLRAWPS